MTAPHSARSSLVIVSALASLTLLSACGGDDDASPAASSSTTTAPSTFATLAPVPATTVPATDPPSVTTEPEASESTYTIVAGDSLYAIAEREGVTLDALVEANAWTDGIDHLILPGDEILIPSASGAETPTADTGAYTEATVELTITGDRTTAISEPLADGLYFSDGYSSDGSTVTFTLSQYFQCDSTTNVPDEPEIECVSGFGTLDAPIATVALAPDAMVTVATGDLDDPTLAGVTAAEFARLVAGESPSAGAPEGYEFSTFLMFVEVADGEAVAARQFYTS